MNEIFMVVWSASGDVIVDSLWTTLDLANTRLSEVMLEVENWPKDWKVQPFAVDRVSERLLIS